MAFRFFSVISIEGIRVETRLAHDWQINRKVYFCALLIDAIGKHALARYA